MSNESTTVASWVGIAALALLIGGAPASAQPSNARQGGGQQEEQPGPWSASAGIGFTLDPGTFLMTLGMEYGPDDADGFSAGPLLQIGISDNNTIVAPTVNGRYSFDLSWVDDEIIQEVQPFVQGGLGFAYIDKDRSGAKKDKDGVGFLMNMGLGFEYPVSETVSLGNSVLFNVLPSRTARQHFFFSWQFDTLRFRF